MTDQSIGEYIAGALGLFFEADYVTVIIRDNIEEPGRTRIDYGIRNDLFEVQAGITAKIDVDRSKLAEEIIRFTSWILIEGDSDDAPKL